MLGVSLRLIVACTALLISLSSQAEIDSFFETNNVQHLALIFEDTKSYIGREVTAPVSINLSRVFLSPLEYYFFLSSRRDMLSGILNMVSLHLLKENLWSK